MWMIPRSCRTPSAAIVAGRTRACAAVRSPWHDARLQHVHGRDHRRVLGGGVDAERDGRRVEEVRIRSRPASCRRSGACPPPAPSMWNAWTDRPANAASVPSTDSTSLSPSVWIASCTSWRSQTSSAVRICAGPGGDVLVDLQRGAAGAQAVLDALGARRRAADEQRGVDRRVLQRGPGRRQAGLRVGAEVPDRAVVLGDHRRHPAGQQRVGDLRREPVHVRVDRRRA